MITSQLCLLCLSSLAQSFVILPHVQIDFAYYFRLAQCHAKCSQKYASIVNRQLNDGNIVDAFNNTSEEMEQCELGCSQHPRKGVVIAGRGRSLSARHDGSRFWRESSASTTSSSSFSPLSRVSLLCQNDGAPGRVEVSGESVEEAILESVQGILGLDIKRHQGHFRLLVQWKQRVIQDGIVREESPAITASIESGSLITVEGMVPGMQYRFLITAIGPAGRLGEAVSSEWFEAIQAEKNPEGSATVRSGYNSEDGATGLLSWSRAHIDSCHYSVSIHNQSTNKNIRLSVDTSGAVLLRHLEMGSRYEVRVAALKGSEGVAEMPKPLHAVFQAMSCRDIHGKGSIKCPPEPVDDLLVSVRQNGSATIAWTPSADPSQVLTYEVLVQPIPPCAATPIKLFLNANSSSAHVELGEERPCELAVRVTNYDLLGHEAEKETRVVLPERPLLMLPPNWEGILMAISSLLFLSILAALLKCAYSCSRRRRNEQKNDNKKQLVGFV